jgi:hypothetical protein
MAVITGQMVSRYAHHLFARIDNDEQSMLTPASWPVTVDGLTGRFWVDADGQVLEITIRPVDPAKPLPWQTPKDAPAATDRPWPLPPAPVKLQCFFCPAETYNGDGICGKCKTAGKAYPPAEGADPEAWAYQ